VRLVHLEIDNFRVIRHARLSFPDAVIGVVGPNGAGKSSLVEAIAWALYGNTAVRSSKDEIKSVYADRGDDCRVRLSFGLGGETYTVERALVGPRERPEAAVLRGDKVEVSGATDTVRFAAGLLGLDWRGFLTSFLARQQELNALADFPPQQRRDHLAGMLGIERLDRALQKLKQDRRVLDERASGLAEQAGRLDETRRRLHENAEHIEQLEPKVNGLLGALESARAAYVESDRVYREHYEKRLRCSELDGRLEACRQSLTSLREQAATASARKAVLETGRDRLAVLDRETASWEQLKTRWEGLRKAVAQATLIAQLRSELNSISETETGLSDQGSRLREDLGRLDEALGAIPADIDAQFADVAAELERARAGYTETKAETVSIEKELTRLNGQVTAIGKVGPDAVCDRCHRPFGDDLPAIRNHLESEHALLAESLAVHRERLEALTVQGQLLKDKHTTLRHASQRRRDLLSKKTESNNRRADLEARLAAATKRKQELETRLAEFAAPDIQPGEQEQVEQQTIRVERLREEALHLQGQLTELPGLIAHLADLRDRSMVAEKKEADLLAQRGTIAHDPALFARIADDHTRSQQAVESARQAHTVAERDLQIARHQHQTCLDELARLQLAADQLETTRQDIFYSEKLGQLFGDFRKVMIAGIRPRLADLAGRLMAEMSGGKYSLVDLDPDYNLRIMDFGQYYGIDRFSGGEKDLASLCLRLAISLALTESAGLERSFVILDEVFGSQDAGRRDLIMEALGGLKARFPQMILITHLDELKHKVETLIEVIPTAGGWSEVSCNGNATHN